MQEAKRIGALAAAKEEGGRERERRRLDRAQREQKNTAWSEKLSKKEEKDKRKDKKKLKKKWLAAHETAALASTQAGDKRPRDESDDAMDEGDDDWDELAREEKMAKRVKKGKVSQKAFDAEFTDL